jgi:hypothetical protein
MPSRHSTLAPQPGPAEAPEGAARLVRALAHGAPFKLRLKPRRDALTRVRHDLRSLVHSVVGYSDLLATPHYGSLTAEQARFVDHVRCAAEHLQELVDTCIELTRPDNDQYTLELPQAPLGQVLRRVRNTLVARGMVCDLTLASELEPHMLTLDMAQLERALVGLSLFLTRDGSIPGALSAAHEGGTLVLRLSVSQPASGHAHVSLERLEDQIGNRDFVRLKLSEVLLTRASAELSIAPSLDAISITLGARA